MELINLVDRYVRLLNHTFNRQINKGLNVIEAHHNSIKEANERMYTKTMYKLNVINLSHSNEGKESK